jgi:hypothetical protein
MKLRGFTVLFLLAAFLLVGASAAFSAAKEATDQKKDPWAWRFNLNVYGWLPWAPVDITLGDTEAHRPEDLSTIWESLKFAATFEAEIHKGPIGVFVAPMYFNLDYSENKQGPFETRKVTLKEQAWVVDYGASYEFGPWDFGKNSKLKLAPYAGARYLNDNIKIEFKPGPTVSDTINFNTPIVGLRALWYFDNPWYINVFGDYGGFDVDGVDQTWQAVGNIGYRFKIKKVSTRAYLGFRYMNIEYSKNANSLKVDIYGPFLGLGIEF